MKNRITIIIVLLIAVAGLGIGTYMYCMPIDQEETVPSNKEEIWIPTKEDIAYQDSMYSIIQHTQQDVDTIKVHIEQIIERLDNKEEADWSGTTQGN